eukprot:747705-Hanusia_phi.AAC.8
MGGKSFLGMTLRTLKSLPSTAQTLNLAQVPAKGSKRASEVVHFVELIALVEDNVQLVLHPVESLLKR